MANKNPKLGRLFTKKKHPKRNFGPALDMMLDVAFVAVILDPGVLAAVGDVALGAGSALAGMAAPVPERMAEVPRIDPPSAPTPDPSAGCDCDCLFGGGGSLVEAFNGGGDDGDGGDD